MCYDINNDSTQNVHDEGEKEAMETNMHSKKQLKEVLICLGIKPGDKVLIHSSYKSLGGIEEGAAGFFEVVMDLLGTEGTLILPTLTFRPVYETKFFDVRETPSCVGYLTEYFRTQVEGVVRSLHPTHSCAVWGKDYDGELKIVDVNIRRLRIKIEDDTANPTFITTVWGFGYKWGA